MVAYNGPIIDSDVHHTFKSEDEIIRRLPKVWREFVSGPDGRRMPIRIAGLAYAHPRGNVNKRLDTFPPDGSPPASDYNMLREQLLDPFNIDRAILAYDLISLHAALPNPAFATAVVSAINDWVVEEWLTIPDDRLCGVVFVPVDTPQVGAAEIKRASRRSDRVVEARLPWTLGKPFGHPIYDPIYAAAVEEGLPVSLHIHGGESQGGLAHHNAAGRANTFLEFHALISQATRHHVASLVTHGVFERFPSLKIVLVETGVAWIPGLLWALDEQYENLRRESSWVKKRPSEYFRDHIRVTTQPLELTDRRDEFVEYLEAWGGMEDILCYSSDYPHWDYDDPRYIARRLPASWAPKVFWGNAADLYGTRLGRLPKRAERVPATAAHA